MSNETDEKNAENKKKTDFNLTVYIVILIATFVIIILITIIGINNIVLLKNDTIRNELYPARGENDNVVFPAGTLVKVNREGSSNSDTTSAAEWAAKWMSSIPFGIAGAVFPNYFKWFEHLRPEVFIMHNQFIRHIISFNVGVVNHKIMFLVGIFQFLAAIVLSPIIHFLLPMYVGAITDYDRKYSGIKATILFGFIITFCLACFTSVYMYCMFIYNSIIGIIFKHRNRSNYLTIFNDIKWVSLFIWGVMFSLAHFSGIYSNGYKMSIIALVAPITIIIVLFILFDKFN